MNAPPKYVLPVPRLFDNLEMLEVMFKEETPARFPVRHSKVVEVFYGFFDTSGRGLGSTLQGRDESQAMIRLGTWSTSTSEENSSNWKELT